MDDEIVVLVNENNKVLGTAPKLETHNAHTPLHRGFSVFLFTEKGEILLQQRNLSKKTFPGVWSNTCCGHPVLDETPIDAAKRRLKFELGIKDVELFEILPHYRYKTEMNGIWENELCPVLVGFSDQQPKVNTEEVAAVKFVLWQKFIDKLTKNPGTYSFWAEEEAKKLSENHTFQTLFVSHVKASRS